MQTVALTPSAAAPCAAPQQRRGVRAQTNKPSVAGAMRFPSLDASLLSRTRALRHRRAATSGASGAGESHEAAMPPPASMGTAERRNVDRSEWLEAEAYGEVSTYASRAPLAACFPATPLKDILPHFEEFTGLPVLDAETHKPLGVVRASVWRAVARRCKQAPGVLAALSQQRHDSGG
jgi:hypothetical protein